MGLKIKLLAFVIGIGFLLFVLRSIKRNNLHPSYSVLWLGLALFLLSVPVLEPFYHWLAASVIGIVDARHVIYIVLIGFLLVYVFYLTQRVSKMSDRMHVLISQLAILEAEVKEKRDIVQG